MKRLLIHAIAAVALAAMLPNPVARAQATGFPDRSIRLVVPYGTGGISDTTARILSPHLSQILGQSVVVDNRPGGASVLGTDLVAKSPPDGYTILFSTTSMAANNYLIKKLPYDVEKDFSPITLVGTAPNVLVVPTDFSGSTLKDLIAQARAKPGALNYGSAGNGSGGHLVTESLKHAAGIELTHIPFKAGSAVMLELMAGRIQMAFATMPLAHPYVTSGKLKAIAVTSAKRSASLPDVPTVAESGVAGFEINEWIGVFAPPGTSPAVVMRLRDAFAKALQHPDVSARLKTLGLETVGGTPSELTTVLRSEIDRWGRLARVTRLEMAE